MTGPLSPEMFLDIHLCYTDAQSAHQMVILAAELGYSAVALSYTAFSDDFTVSKGKKDKSASKTDIPCPVILLPETMEVLSLDKTPMKIFKRLSVPTSDPRVFHELANHLLSRTFDIISVAPSDDKLLQQALDDVNVDIIELDLGSKRCLNVKRKHARQAQAADKVFEICYRDALGDADKRMTFFSNCRRLLQDLSPGDRGRVPDVVVLSSGITDVTLMKSPLETSYLCDLFGFPVDVAKVMNSKTARFALENALAKRRTARSAIQILD